MSAATSTEKKSKFKFSNLLHSKDKDTTTTANPQHNSNSDSGYGGSEPSVTEPYKSNIPPSLISSDESRNNPNDSNATVTTTTTTTTTTTSGGNGGGPSATIENANAPQDQSDYGFSNEQGGSPPIPTRSSLRDRSPNPPTMQGSGNNAIQDRSPMPGTSPGRTNFSYPNRGPFVQSAPPTQQQQQQQQQQAQQSTLQGLKSAAIGINGASETLRGTINSAVDRHTNAPPDILAEHERTIQGGKHDMDRMHEGRANPAPPPKGILKKLQR
ncbi:MAG: hypothetical protein Q9196_003965 [Gyalolechia fulgens]